VVLRGDTATFVHKLNDKVSSIEILPVKREVSGRQFGSSCQTLRGSCRPAHHRLERSHFVLASSRRGLPEQRFQKWPHQVVWESLPKCGVYSQPQASQASSLTIAQVIGAPRTTRARSSTARPGASKFGAARGNCATARTLHHYQSERVGSFSARIERPDNVGASGQ
jgi:hypothetical protein